MSLTACLEKLSLSLFLWSTARREAVEHVATPELPSQEGRAQSCGTHGSIGTHLIKEVRSGAEGHMAASELTSAMR
jgi:hypothetical protein